MQCRRTPQHTERRDQTDQPKAMVAMQMRDEHSRNFRKSYMRTAQLYLCPFPAINHEVFAADLNNLRRGKMLQRRQRTAATQNMDFKRFHYFCRL